MPWPSTTNTMTYCFQENTCEVWFWFDVCEETMYQIQGMGGYGTLLYSESFDCNGLAIVQTNTTTLGWQFQGDAPPGRYFLVVSIQECGVSDLTIFLQTMGGGCGIPPCGECLPDPGMEPGERYILTAWAHQDGADADAIGFTNPKITVVFEDSTEPDPDLDIVPSGAIIDGWQRMEAVFTIQEGTTALRVLFGTTEGTVYYDDIRLFPADASMKCYVYDPANLRFVAELDERHYATFYEYDNEGRPTRVKKETERGIMTIQETRHNTSKLSGQ